MADRTTHDQSPSEQSPSEQSPSEQSPSDTGRGSSSDTSWWGDADKGGDSNGGEDGFWAGLGDRIEGLLGRGEEILERGVDIAHESVPKVPGILDTLGEVGEAAKGALTQASDTLDDVGDATRDTLTGAGQAADEVGDAAAKGIHTTTKGISVATLAIVVALTMVLVAAAWQITTGGLARSLGREGLGRLS